MGIFRYSRKIARRLGVSVDSSTPSSYLEEFFRKMAPIATEHPLIRIGGGSDGGYLVPDDLEGIKTSFSPGVAKTSNFENDLAQRGIRCFMADYSVDEPPIAHPLFTFEKKFLGLQNDERYMTLQDWVRRNVAPDDSEMILQMDIEGSEYEVLFSSSDELLKRFRIIVAEFHDLDALFDRHGYRYLNIAFSRLLNLFDVVHIHPNNYDILVDCKGYRVCPLMEFTFLRKDRIKRRSPAKTFPHPLDQNNWTDGPNIVVPSCWYGK